MYSSPKEGANKNLFVGEQRTSIMFQIVLQDSTQQIRLILEPKATGIVDNIGCTNDEITESKKYRVILLNQEKFIQPSNHQSHQMQVNQKVITLYFQLKHYAIVSVFDVFI